jgi:transcription elongation factor Elf1
MLDNVDLFKSRLAQVKAELQKEGKIADNLFFSALLLDSDKNKNQRNNILQILTKHGWKIKKGYIQLPEGNRDEIIEAFLSDGQIYIMAAFGVSAVDLEADTTEPTSASIASGLFKMQEEYGAGTKETEEEAPAPEFGLGQASEYDYEAAILPASKPPTVPPEAASEFAPEPPLYTGIDVASEYAEQALPARAPEDLPAAMPEPEPQSTPEMNSEPVASEYQELERMVPHEAEVSAPPVPERPAEKSSSKSWSTHPLPVKKQANTAQQASSLQEAAAAIKAAPKSREKPGKTGKNQGKTGKTGGRNREKPKAKPAAAPTSYDYYVCARCGAETSKSEIKHSRSFLECPICAFQFSPSEATIIRKSAAQEVEAYGAEEDISSAGSSQVADKGTKAKKTMMPNASTEAPEMAGIDVDQPLKEACESDESSQGQPAPAPASQPDASQGGEAAACKCPKCGSTEFTKIQDRSKVISYNPLMYGFKKKCLKCSKEYD